MVDLITALFCTAQLSKKKNKSQNNQTSKSIYSKAKTHGSLGLAELSISPCTGKVILEKQRRGVNESETVIHREKCLKNILG